MKDKVVKLKNGGTFIYSKSKLNKCTAVEVGFLVGAEADKRLGTAHFLEHTLFKKTKNRSNLDVEMDRNRIVFLNASTSMDYLIIKFFRTNKLLEKSMEFAYDVLMNSVIDDEYIESEKGVIKEELQICMENEVRDVYVWNIKQALSNSKFASDIVGKTANNISLIKFKDLEKFKQEHFNGNNFVISVVTSMPYFKTKKFVNKYFASKIKYKSDYKKPASYYDINVIDKETSLKINKNSLSKISVQLSFKIDANEIDIFTKNYNYSFLTRYLSGSQGELFLKLRNKGLIYRLDSDISSFKNESLFNIVFESSKEKVKDILQIISDEIKKIVNEKLSVEVTEAYKKNLEYFADEKMPVKPDIKCHLNLMDFLSFGKLFKIKNRQRKVLRNGVTPDAVQKVARSIFNKKTKMFVTVLGDITKRYVPDIEYFIENFLVSESDV